MECIDFHHDNKKGLEALKRAKAIEEEYKGRLIVALEAPNLIILTSNEKLAQAYQTYYANRYKKQQANALERKGRLNFKIKI